MRQDWIEFKRDGMKANDEHNFLLRPEYIVAIDGKEGKDMTEIQYDTGSDQLTFYASEPYEQVKQKIMDAEKVDLSDVVVESFTREEYTYILHILENELKALEEMKSIDAINPSSLVNQLRYKLNEILKEDK